MKDRQKEIMGYSGVFRINGNSMYPLLKNGEIVFRLQILLSTELFSLIIKWLFMNSPDWRVFLFQKKRLTNILEITIIKLNHKYYHKYIKVVISKNIFKYRN